MRSLRVWFPHHVTVSFFSPEVLLSAAASEVAAPAAVEADAVLLPPQAAKLRAIAPAMVAAAIFLNFIIVLLPCSVALGTCGFLS